MAGSGPQSDHSSSTGFHMLEVSTGSVNVGIDSTWWIVLLIVGAVVLAMSCTLRYILQDDRRAKKASQEALRKRSKNDGRGNHEASWTTARYSRRSRDQCQEEDYGNWHKSTPIGQRTRPDHFRDLQEEQEHQAVIFEFRNVVLPHLWEHREEYMGLLQRELEPIHRRDRERIQEVTEEKIQGCTQAIQRLQTATDYQSQALRRQRLSMEERLSEHARSTRNFTSRRLERSSPKRDPTPRQSSIRESGAPMEELLGDLSIDTIPTPTARASTSAPTHLKAHRQRSGSLPRTDLTQSIASWTPPSSF